VNEGAKSIIYPVSDAAQARTLFTTLLGVEPYADEPYYVGFKIGDQEIGLDPHGHQKGITGLIAYFHVDNMQGTLQPLLAAGASIVHEPRDVGGGKLIATVNDADGNVIGLVQEAG
jgi:predicted enzyme related to lactoylglutathione lyase